MQKGDYQMKLDRMRKYNKRKRWPYWMLTQEEGAHRLLWWARNRG